MTPEQVLNRKRIVEMSYEARTPHLGSALSVIDIIEAVYSIKGPEDKFVLSNGHAAVALYAVLERYGLLSDPSIERLGVHPDRNPNLGIEVSSGSLGQGLPIAVGMALADRSKNVYCCVSDGECAEGSIWEALRVAQEQRLDNLRVIVNANGFDASDPVDLETLLARFQAQGCAVLVVDGHSLEELTGALSLRVGNIPLVLFAKTDVEQLPILSGLSAHYKVLSRTELEQSLAFLDAPQIYESSSVVDDGDGFYHLREVATRSEHPKLARQLWDLCETISNRENIFRIDTWWTPEQIRVFKNASREWIIQCLDVESPEAGIYMYRFVTFFVSNQTVLVCSLAVDDHLKKDTIGELHSSVHNLFTKDPEEFRGLSRSLSFRDQVSWMVSELQEVLVVNSAVTAGAQTFSFEHWGRTPHAAKNTVHHFVSTCRKYPELMSGAEMRVGLDGVSSSGKALGAILEALEENGLVSLGARLRTNPLTVKLFDLRKIQLGEGFELKSSYGYLLSFKEKQL